MASTPVNISISRPVHKRITDIRRKLSEQRGREVSTSEALEILLDRAELLEAQ